ncbi:hypothetical protein [Cellulomonas endophytica]|uniref:hypothetical protein n=1 Tax=Cellulomonas endophytica TaxID=2494735 RepID=UPI001010C556|nr:hypothetical protein [Cellulomonas endophytica]
MTSVWSEHEASPWPVSLEFEAPGPGQALESPFAGAAATPAPADGASSGAGSGGPRGAAVPALAHEAPDPSRGERPGTAGRAPDGALWVPGAERVRNPRSAGGTYLDSPWRFVFHTVEGEPSVDGFRRLAAHHPNPPHLWAMPSADLLLQTVPLDRSAYALARPGTTPTNRFHAVQVEVWGFAARMGGTPPEVLAWLADRLLAPVARLVPLDLTHVSPVAPGEACYGTASRCRMSVPEWRAFDGVTGHHRVPDNTHWDPGALDLPAIAARARSTLERGPGGPPGRSDAPAGGTQELLADHDGPGFASEAWAEDEASDGVPGGAGWSEASPSAEWQETEVWLPAPPGLSVGTAADLAALRAAVQGGQRDETVLTDLVLFRRHPERGGRPLSVTEPDFARLSQEWLQIRDVLVRPLLGGSAPPATGAPATPPATPPGTAPAPGAPATGTPSGSALRWATNANSAAVPAYAQRVLTEIVRAAGLSQVLVSSTQRTPADQARVMFNNIRQLGVQSQLDLYGSAGDKVIGVYVASTAARRTDAQIMADMERKVVELGPPNVSRHTADPDVLAVIDIAPSSVTDKAAFERAVKADARVSLFLQPPTDPAYHVEIPVVR